jgi:preprotein translocase subunit SecG
MWHFIIPTLLFLTSVFLILLVLIQRGRGGGLAGAFGGLGGQSAFGTKAGDLFTRITIGVATVWIILCAASVKLLNDSDSGMLNPGLGNAAPLRAGDSAPAPGGTGGAAAPAGKDQKAEPAGDKQGEKQAEQAPASEPKAESAPADAAPADAAPQSGDAKSEAPAANEGAGSEKPE